MLPHNDDAQHPQLRQRLPKYYQENERLLEPLLGAGESVLESMHGVLSRAAAEWSVEATRDLRQRWFQGAPEFSAAAGGRFPGPTPERLRAWFRQSYGVTPELWVGFVTQPESTRRASSPSTPSRLKLSSADWPSVLVLWVPERYGNPPSSWNLTRDQLPAGTRLQVVVLPADEEERPPYHGRTVVGERWWDSHESAAESPL